MSQMLKSSGALASATLTSRILGMVREIVYAQALPLCSDLYLTRVKRVVDGDAFFPPFEDRFEFAEEILDCPDFKILHYRNRTVNG